MSQQPQPRRVRRQPTTNSKAGLNAPSTSLPGPLRLLSNPKLFAIVGIIFAGGVILGLMGGIITGGTNTSGPPHQANELPDESKDTAGEPGASATAAPATKRYTQAPPMTIDTTRKYVATIKTSKGDIQVELDPSQAPESVNSFVFLANDGYYNDTPFMQVVTYKDGSKFTVQAGDPTGTGLGTPGYSLKKESTTAPFVRGAVGMCGTSDSNNGAQFFISYVDDPAVRGCTIFGKVTSGLDVLERLSLTQVANGRATGSGDKIQSVAVAP
ncbi:MAG TPA: peptidylprolyl isomerase [Dehalococcoidia bacterium]|nr:peptidylprolyl isomerase [Dehalococcoidia bacterium]